MKALVFEEKLSLQDVPVPNPLPDEALVKGSVGRHLQNRRGDRERLHELSRGART